MPGRIPGRMPGGRAPGGPPLIRTIPLGRGPPLPLIGDPGVAARIGDPGVPGAAAPGWAGLSGEATPGDGEARRACGLSMAGLGLGLGLAMREAGVARRTPNPAVPAAI